MAVRASISAKLPMCERTCGESPGEAVAVHVDVRVWARSRCTTTDAKADVDTRHLVRRANSTSPLSADCNFSMYGGRPKKVANLCEEGAVVPDRSTKRCQAHPHQISHTRKRCKQTRAHHTHSLTHTHNINTTTTKAQHYLGCTR